MGCSLLFLVFILHLWLDLNLWESGSPQAHLPPEGDLLLLSEGRTENCFTPGLRGSQPESQARLLHRWPEVGLPPRTPALGLRPLGHPWLWVPAGLPAPASFTEPRAAPGCCLCWCQLWLLQAPGRPLACSVIPPRLRRSPQAFGGWAGGTCDVASGSFSGFHGWHGFVRSSPACPCLEMFMKHTSRH